MEIENVKTKVLTATITVFNEKGLKFTMDDIARAVGMSKKTLYVLFDGKEALLQAMVDYCFSSIKEAEHAVLSDESLDTVDKLRRILGVMPVTLQSVDLRKLDDLRDKYPEIYREVSLRLESDWEPTIELIEQGIREGRIRRISVPVFKTILEATIEHFFSSDVLISAGLTYQEGLDELTRTMVDGILV